MTKRSNEIKLCNEIKVNGWVECDWQIIQQSDAKLSLNSKQIIIMMQSGF